MRVKKDGNIPIEAYSYDKTVSPYVYELNKIKNFVKKHKDKQVKFYRNYIMILVNNVWTCVNVSKEQYESFIK